MILKKKPIGPILLLIIAAAFLFIFRYQIINRVQMEILAGIRGKAVFSNAVFLRPGNSHEQHRIFSLKGLERIWPHRVNSIQRLRYLYPEFAGFECDIRYHASSGQLYLAHDPGEFGSQVFQDYLEQADWDRKLFWLDVKNLDSRNLESFCSALQQLDGQYGIKNRIIIESPDTAALNRISKSGWLCSLYLPSLPPAGPDDLKHWIAAVASSLKINTGFISQDARMHDFMTQNFPGAKQLIWDIRFWDGMNKELLLKQANDTNLLVSLINVKSPGYR
jgi:hypothetical protein